MVCSSRGFPSGRLLVVTNKFTKDGRIILLTTFSKGPP